VSWPQDRDALVHQHLPLADGIARSFCRRYGDLVELDDLRQEARLELVWAAARCRGERPEPFLQRCIAGALRHHIRNRALLVRLPAKRRDDANAETSTTSPPAGFYTPETLATYLGVSTSTIYSWNSSGYGPPFVKLGNLVRYTYEDVELWLARQLELSRG